MCGIAGFLHPSLPADGRAQVLGQMLTRIIHRGPDGQGQWVEGPFGFGMRRLSIIDLVGGQQPIWNEDETIGVVFNGEIYNYVELRSRLSRHAFRTRSDTEVLVHLYEEKGSAMLDDLRGMFAFAILDRVRRKLFIARDHFGQKPLYYYHRDGLFAFASELKSLFPVPGLDLELDSSAFLHYAAWLSLPAPRTHFKNILKLQAGHCLTLSLDKPEDLKVDRYWEWDLRAPAEIRNVDEAADALHTLLEESLRLHFRADVPVGILLSSGLDSRAVAQYAREIGKGEVKTFSAGFEDAEECELPEAESAARELNTQHFSVRIGPEDYAAEIERIAWHLDEPVGDPAALAVLRVCELARTEVKVVLSGEGSDELFAGYAGRYLSALQVMARSASFRRWRAVLPKPTDTYHPGRWTRLLQRVHRSEGAEALGLRREGFAADPRTPRGLTLQQFSSLEQAMQEMSFGVVGRQRDLLSDLLVLDARWQLAESLLQKADKMSMAASLELRAPFLDKEIAALASRVDSACKLTSEGTGKLLLRRCLAKRIPGFGQPPKRGFPVPLKRWFTGPLRFRLEEEILSPRSSLASLLDRGRLEQAWREFLNAEWDGTYVFYALWLYAVWRKQGERVLFHRNE